MTCKHIFRYERDCDIPPSWIGSLHGNVFRMDAAAPVDDEMVVVSLIFISLRSMLRRLLRYVNTDDADCDADVDDVDDDVELKWFVCVWLIALLWFRPKPLCVAVKFKLLLFILLLLLPLLLLLLLLLLWLSCIDVDVVPADELPVISNMFDIRNNRDATPNEKQTCWRRLRGRCRYCWWESIHCVTIDLLVIAVTITIEMAVKWKYDYFDWSLKHSMCIHTF